MDRARSAATRYGLRTRAPSCRCSGPSSAGTRSSSCSPATLDDPRAHGFVIHGAAGVGKTRLADQCLAHGRRAGPERGPGDSDGGLPADPPRGARPPAAAGHRRRALRSRAVMSRGAAGVARAGERTVPSSSSSTTSSSSTPPRRRSSASSSTPIWCSWSPRSAACDAAARSGCAVAAGPGAPHRPRRPRSSRRRHAAASRAARSGRGDHGHRDLDGQSGQRAVRAGARARRDRQRSPRRASTACGGSSVPSSTTPRLQELVAARLAALEPSAADASIDSPCGSRRACRRWRRRRRRRSSRCSIGPASCRCAPTAAARSVTLAHPLLRRDPPRPHAGAHPSSPPARARRSIGRARRPSAGGRHPIGDRAPRGVGVSRRGSARPGGPSGPLRPGLHQVERLGHGRASRRHDARRSGCWSVRHCTSSGRSSRPTRCWRRPSSSGDRR